MLRRAGRRRAARHHGVELQRIGYSNARLNAKLEPKSGRLQLRPTGWRPRRRPRLQTQVREDLLDDRRQGQEALAWSRHKRSSGPFVSGPTLQDRSDDLQLTAAVRAVLEVDLKAKLQRRQLKRRLSNLAQLSRTGL